MGQLLSKKPVELRNARIRVEFLLFSRIVQCIGGLPQALIATVYGTRSRAGRVAA
jgi:hypothetical protein